MNNPPKCQSKTLSTTYTVSDNQVVESIKSENALLPRGRCEQIIIGRHHILALGRTVHEGNLAEVQLTIANKAFKYDKYEIVRFKRNDTPPEYSGYPNSDCCGFAILLESPTVITLVPKLRASIKLSFSNRQSITLEAGDLCALEKKQLKQIMAVWDFTNPTHLAAVFTLFHPVLKDIFATDQPCKTTTNLFGNQPKSPPVSLIVPLYGRVDFMQFQLSNFARHKSIADSEIIYVLDDPNLREQAQELAVWSHELTGLSFVLLELERNVGYARANNIAVEHCHADILLLLNSDILPKDTDWLAKLLHHFRNTDNMGILGARLIYEDQSLQHDGMEPIEIPEIPGLTLNNHPYKGWPLTLVPNPAELVSVDLVTAACAMILKSNFKKAGGFDTRYFLGDFEDSDLCQKLINLGLANYVARDVVLYHLERQSQKLFTQDNWKDRLTFLNAAFYRSRLETNFSVEPPLENYSSAKQLQQVDNEPPDESASDDGFSIV